MRRALIAIRLTCLVLVIVVGLQAWNLSGEETTLTALDRDLGNLEQLIAGPEEEAVEAEPETQEEAETPDPKATTGKAATGKADAEKASKKADGKKNSKTETPKDAPKPDGKTPAATAKAQKAPEKKDTARTFPSHYELIGRSGIFGIAPKKQLPPPGLEGIAGGYAFIRSPNGATGLVEEGGEYQGIKVLKIGTNRVLIEYQGKKQELTLHAGLGGETLMPPPEKTTATEKGKP